MPIRFYAHCLGRRDRFAVAVSRSVLAAPLLFVIGVKILRGFLLLLPGDTFAAAPLVYRLFAESWLSEYLWGVAEFGGGALLLLVSLAYLFARTFHGIRAALSVLCILLFGEAIFSAGVAMLFFVAGPALSVWVWFGGRFMLAGLAFLETVCVLQGECGAIKDNRLAPLADGASFQERERLRRMPDEGLRREYSRRAQMRRA